MNLTKGYWDSYYKNQLLEQGQQQYVEEVVFDGDEEMEGTAKDNYQRFWVPLRRYDSEKGEEIVQGEVQCTVQIVPLEIADKNPQGPGRDNPNSDPFCPPPVGRIELSLNPFKMLMQLIPPKLRKKLCKIMCCALCASMCVAMAPLIISNLLSALISSLL